MALTVTDRQLNLDFYKNAYINTNVAQYDIETRTVNIALFNNGKPFPLNTTEHKVQIRMRKPDNTLVINDETINSNGTVTVLFTGQMCTAGGKAEAELVIYDLKREIQTDEGKVHPELHSAHFVINILETVVPENAIKSSDEFGYIQNLELDLTKCKQAMEQIISDYNDPETGYTAIWSKNEQDRKDAETIRAAQERTRSSAESNRNRNETSRDTAEKERIKNENERVQSEITRTSNENTRVSKENERREEETKRISREGERIRAENLRDQKEIDRIKHEDSREDAETQRITNEKIRQENEGTRLTQEEERQSNTATAIANAQEATTDAQNWATEAEKQAQAAEKASTDATPLIEEMRTLIADDNIVHVTSLGVSNGVATLDENAKVPASQLPSFVDDVLEGEAIEVITDPDTGSKTAKSFILEGETEPCTPESSKIYIDLESGITFRWAGSIFASVGSAITLGYTSSTAFPGSEGADLKTRVDSLETYHNNIPASDIKYDHTSSGLVGANVQAAIDEIAQEATPTHAGLMSSLDKRTVDSFKKAIEINTTLYANSWVNKTQFVPTIDLSGFENCSINITEDSTPDQQFAAMIAEIAIIDYDEERNGFTFTCNGIVPSQDIPITIYCAASMLIAELEKLVPSTVGVDARYVGFDNTGTGLKATTVEDAIKELSSTISTSIIDDLFNSN